jgi:hypothetical protein
MTQAQITSVGVGGKTRSATKTAAPPVPTIVRSDAVT